MFNNNYSKFCKLYDLEENKKLFPYEAYESPEEMTNQLVWPNYSLFKSSLGRSSRSFISELPEIVKKFESFGDMLDHFNISSDPFTLIQQAFTSMPFLTDEQKKILDEEFFISPKLFLEHEEEFNANIRNGKYKNFIDYLKVGLEKIITYLILIKTLN